MQFLNVKKAGSFDISVCPSKEYYYVDISLTRFDMQTYTVCSICTYALDMRFACEKALPLRYALTRFALYCIRPVKLFDALEAR